LPGTAWLRLGRTDECVRPYMSMPHTNRYRFLPRWCKVFLFGLPRLVD